MWNEHEVISGTRVQNVSERLPCPAVGRRGILRRCMGQKTTAEAVKKWEREVTGWWQMRQWNFARLDRQVFSLLPFIRDHGSKHLRYFKLQCVCSFILILTRLSCNILCYFFSPFKGWGLYSSNFCYTVKNSHSSARHESLDWKWYRKHVYVFFGAYRKTPLR